MKINGLIFWRTSLIFWVVVFLIVVVQEAMGHVFVHPIEVVLVPIIFVIMSALQLNREIRSRKQH